MRIVIDSNRVFAALIKDHTTRSILFNRKFQFFAPSFIKSEIYKYKKEIMRKTKMTKEEINFVLRDIFNKIEIISYREYQDLIKYFKNKINDPKDVSYLAVCKTIKAEGIWTHDPHFKEQKIIRIFTNIDFLRLSEVS